MYSFCNLEFSQACDSWYLQYRARCSLSRVGSPMLVYMHALLLIGANTYQMDALIRQHAAPPQPTSASSTASPDAAEPMVSAPAWLPAEIFYSAGRGELQKVVKWLDKRLSTGRSTDALKWMPRSTDALYSIPTPCRGCPAGQTAAVALLHVAATNGDLVMVRELLKRGASVDIRSHAYGGVVSTPLMDAAYGGHLSVVLALLQYSASPDLQDIDGNTALTLAASKGHEACVQVLLQRKANTKLLTKEGRTALWWAEAQGHTATAQLIRQHASCLSLSLGVALCAVLPLTWSWVVLSVVLGAIATVAFSRTLTAGPGQHRAARRRRPHRPAVGRGPGPHGHRGAHPAARSAAAACRRLVPRGELSRLAARRGLRVGRERRAAEGGQVAAQGRAGRRTLLYYNC